MTPNAESCALVGTFAVLARVYMAFASEETPDLFQVVKVLQEIGALDLEPPL